MTEIKNLPFRLRETGFFCCWRLEQRGERTTKVPYNPQTGGGAMSNNPATFAPLPIAERAAKDYDGLGVGVFNDLGAIDIDHCVGDDGVISEMAVDIISTMNAYTEYSPSGKGIRILFLAPGFQYDKAKYYTMNAARGLEVYIAGCTSKFVTVTGNVLAPLDLEVRTEQLATVLEKYMVRPTKKVEQRSPSEAREMDDLTLIEKAKQGKNGAAFSALWAGDTSGYASHSEADMALCNALAWWTNGDAERVDRLFRLSGLMREKWDRPQSGSTYGALTVQNAVQTRTGGYDPASYQPADSRKAFDDPPPLVERLAQLRPDENPRYSWTDIGNGYLFADCFKEIARYVPERKKWYLYNGAVWYADTGGLKAMELCKELADALTMYALTIEDERRRKDYLAHASKWQRRPYRETILKDASGVHSVGLAEFDKDPLVLNCLNGTLDLRTRDFHSHRADDLLSKQAGVNYDPAARSERWERFIDEVMEGDQEKAVFLQKALGLSLTGDTSHECFFLLYGPKSRNGKGTCMETFMKLMGNYGRTARPESITQKQGGFNTNAPSEDIARLAGARFVNISEPDKHMVLSTALVKTLTGNDTVTARFLGENSFEYRPDFKMFINTNHLPSVTDVTLFSSGRVKVILFDRHFEEHEQDKTLKDELARPENLSGVLNWCIEGWRLLQETGFDPPASVIAATEQYRQDSDKMSRFMADELEEGLEYEVRTSDAFTRFQTWCAANGFKAGSIKSFTSEIKNLISIERKRPKDGGAPTTMILGYRLKGPF